MKLLDFDYDDEKTVVTFEIKNIEISAICYQLKHLIISMGFMKDKKIMQELYDCLLKVIFTVYE